MSCFGGHEEKIFLLELTVERLLLRKEKYKEEFSCEPPIVKIKLLEFPVLKITRRPRDNCAAFPIPPYDENEGLIYASGKTILFVMKPTVLVKTMQIKPMSIGVFRENETFPIAEGTVTISGCLCDQAAMSGNDEKHRPPPFEMYGTYGLCDPGKNPSGSIKIFMRLTFFGDHIISHFQLYQNSCIFKNDFDGEMRVTRVGDDDDEDEGEDDEEGEGEGENFKMPGRTALAQLRSGVQKNSKDDNENK